MQSILSYGDDESDDDINRGTYGSQAKKNFKDNKRKTREEEMRTSETVRQKCDVAEAENHSPLLVSVDEYLFQNQTVVSNETRPPNNCDIFTSRFTATKEPQSLQKKVAPCPVDNQKAEFDETNKPPLRRGQETSSTSDTTTRKSIDQREAIDTKQMDEPTSPENETSKLLTGWGVPSKTKNEMLPRSSPSSRFDWVDLIAGLSRKDTALNKARMRNVNRLKEANERDGNDLSKYLPGDIREIFPFGLEGPDDDSIPSPEWTTRVAVVGRTQCRIPTRPLFSFATDKKSVQHNTEFLARRGWDLAAALKEHAGTTVDHGSEFRPVGQLSSIVGRHPNFSFLKKTFEEGFHYHLTHKLSETERTDEYDAQYDRGNHQSAILDKEQVVKLLGTDVLQGFALPVDADQVQNLRGVHLQPGGIVSQYSINSDGSRKLKKRFTHDLSFSLTLDAASINDRIDMTKYPDMVYGWCLPRILHYLAALRHRNPGRKIFISKYDYSDAYKRISQDAETAAATVIRVDDIAYVCLRMVFGGSPNPAGFSGFSETLTDLANELAMSDYDPIVHGTSPSIKQTHLVFREKEGEESAPEDNEQIGEACIPAFEVNTEHRESFRDCFIDDIIDCHLDTPANRHRSPHVVQMAVHVMSRPHAGSESEPIPRKPLLGPEKLEA